MQDRSQQKSVSHGRLVAFIAKYNITGLYRVYQKKQLKSLCEAYDVNVTSRDNKTVLSEKLVEAIKLNSSIPHIFPVDDRQYMITENIEDNGSIRIRLRLGGKLNNFI